MATPKTISTIAKPQVKAHPALPPAPPPSLPMPPGPLPDIVGGDDGGKQRHSVWLPDDIHELVELCAKRLGMTIGSFMHIAIIREAAHNEHLKHVAEMPNLRKMLRDLSAQLKEERSAPAGTPNTEGKPR